MKMILFFMKTNKLKLKIFYNISPAKEDFSKYSENNIREFCKFLEKKSGTYKSYLIKNETFINSINSITKIGESILEKIYIINNKLKTVPICPICNLKTKKFKNNHYLETCSGSCGSKLGIKSIKQKYRIFPSQTKQAKEKRLQTNFQRYDSSTFIHSKTGKEKIKNIFIKKYGVDNPWKNKDVINKIQETMLIKYGKKHALQAPILKKKQEITMQERYNVTNSMFDDRLKNKNKFSNRSFYIKNILPIKLNKQKELLNIIPLWKIEDYDGTSTVDYKWLHLTCKTEFYSPFHENGSYVRCKKCFPDFISFPQKFLFDKLKQICEINNIEILQNVRDKISPKEIDIFFPKFNLGIEVNGIFWHQENKSSTSLLEKTNLCKDKNITLLHFWDIEILENLDTVINIIKSKLNLITEKIYARKCIIKELKNEQTKHFLTQHLAGHVNAKINLGLFYANKLVCVASFSKHRFKKSNQYELIRFCSLNNVQIIGGLSKLISFFKKLYNVREIITYADKRISIGKAYSMIGKKLYETPPNYFYSKRNMILSRYQCQKNKLKSILGEKFNPLLTEKQNMLINDWMILKDCGNIVYSI